MPRMQFQTLTEPMYYILLSLDTPRYGYEIMQRVTEITDGRVLIGAGTLYALLARFEEGGMIAQVEVVDRKKIYALTDFGRQILLEEYQRLNMMVMDGRDFLGFS